MQTKNNAIQKCGQSGLLALLILFGGLFVPQEAHADFKFCNQTSYVLRSALAYDDGGMQAQGWQTLLPGKCISVLKGDLSEDTYYTYAESVSGHTGGIKYFEGDEPFCLSDDDEFIISERTECSDQGLRQGNFIRVDVDNDKEWVATFTEPAKFNTNKAEIAGVQRLLADIGFDPGRIDGELGRKTRNAIASFKRSYDLKASGLVTDELVSALADAANAEAEERGFKFCNQTGQNVWAAIGYQKKRTWFSKGWWMVSPGACAKVIKDALTEQAYYIHALLDDPDGEVVIAQGDTQLCTAEVKFDIKGREDCDLHGYASTGFQKVDTKGAKSWTSLFTVN